MSIFDNTENTPALDLKKGDRIVHRDILVTITGDKEDDPNQFGLPWFKFRVEADDGRWGYARFGPTGHAPRVVTA